MTPNGEVRQRKTSTWDRLKRTLLGQPSADQQECAERLDELLDEVAEATQDTTKDIEGLKKQAKEKENGTRRAPSEP